MAKSKHSYKIIFNKEPKKYKEYIFDYGSIKNISIKIAENAISISALSGSAYSVEDIIFNNRTNIFFSFAIKRALLIYILTYSSSINIKTIDVDIDDNLKNVINTKNGDIVPIYSLINGKLRHPVVNQWSDESINELLKIKKSKEDSRISALYAFITSKSKEYEAERFIYLWMAFNGLYTYISKSVMKANPFSDGQIDKSKMQEYELILFMQSFLGFGHNRQTIETNNNDDTIIAHEVMSFIRHLDDINVTKDSLLYGKHQHFKNSIENYLQHSEKIKEHYNLNAYSYLITQFSYFFRCNIIHANKPFPLFGYKDDNEIKCLSVINSLLEECIDNIIFKFFDANKSDELMEIIKSIELTSRRLKIRKEYEKKIKKTN